MSNNEISSDDFVAFKNEIHPKISELKVLSIDISDVESELKKYLKKGIQLIKNISQVYDYAALDEKQKIIRSIFKENEVRTGNLNEVIPLVGIFCNGCRGNNKKTEGENHLQSCKVPLAGLTSNQFLMDLKIFWLQKPSIDSTSRS